MGNKKSFVLRMDEEVYKAIEKWAADEFRSVNGQIEWILDQQLKIAKRNKPTTTTPKNSSRQKNS